VRLIIKGGHRWVGFQICPSLPGRVGIGRGTLDLQGGNRRSCALPVLSTALYERFTSLGKLDNHDRPLPAMG